VVAFVVERSLPVEEIGELAGELARFREAAAEVAATGSDVVYLYSLFVPADRMCYTAIEAPDAATVLEVLRRSAIPNTARVLPAVRFDHLTRTSPDTTKSEH
jgi:hypothetical protein